MSDRSDIRIAMSKNGYIKFKKYIEEHIEDYREKYILSGEPLPFELNDDFNLLKRLDVNEGLKNGVEVYLGWNDIEWYPEGREEVAAIEYGLKRLENEDYGYAFSRIGDYYDDIETRYFESTKKDAIGYIQMPFMNRYFDDEMVINRIKDVNEKAKIKNLER